MAELFHLPVNEGAVGYGNIGEQLPGVSQMSAAERPVLLARQAVAALSHLGLAAEAGRATPSVVAVSRLLVASPRDEVTVRESIWRLHIDTLEFLTVSDFQLGKAHSLGRALTETAILPVGANPDERRKTFLELFEDGRIGELDSWLTGLRSDFG